MSEDFQKICTRLYQLNREDLYAFVIRNMRDEAGALDMVQDVFFNFYKIFQKKKQPPNDTECRMYLFRIARNLMINHSRTAYQRKVDLVENFDSTKAKINQSTNSLESSVLDQMEIEQAEEMLQNLLGDLDEKYRSLILLRYNANLKLDEIASIMGTTISTVSRQLDKAERLLKESAKETGFEFTQK